MASIQKYLRDKRAVEEAEHNASKTRGAYEQAMKELKKTFGCRDLKRAKRLLKSKRHERDKDDRVFVLALSAFENKWGHKL